jgi:choline dehydrogenase-like flavoprotein
MSSQDYPRGADVVIVGSGLIGATYARIIAEAAPDASIVMLEAGPRLTRRYGAHVRSIGDAAAQAEAKRRSQGPDSHLSADAMASPDRPIAAGQYLARPGTFLAGRGAGDMPAAALSSCVGGMGVHWTCAIPRPGSTEIIPFIPQAEMDAALDEAERLLGKTDGLALDTPVVRHVGSVVSRMFAPLLAGARPVQSAPTAGRRVDGALEWYGTDKVLGPLAEPGDDRFRLLSDTLCRRILHRSGRANGVVVDDLPSGSTYEIAAQQIIVAADSLRTPQLLHASGIRPQALGRHLNDHLSVSATVRLSGEGTAAATTENAGLDVILGAFWIPFDAERHPWQGQVTCYGGADGAFARLGWFLPKTIQESNGVFFSDEETDASGMPAMRFVYALDDRDRASIDGATREIAELAARLGPCLPGQAPHPLPLGSSLHYQGTLRMGRIDDGQSVCDRNCRVWGFENLHVGGNGVIPTQTACNPTLTSVALAILSARSITG